MSRHPEVKWAERADKVYLTVMLPDAKNPKVNLEPEGTFTFSATGGAGDNAYELKLDLFDKVNVEESKISYGVRSIFCVLEKAEVKWWNRLLRGDGKPPHYVKVDWDKWADEDDDTGAGDGNDLDLGGMDFSKFGDMGGMGGMGGLGGMGGMEGLGGLGGLGGMEGLGGLGGMGGMGGGPGEFDESDEDDDEQVSKEEDAGDAEGSKAAEKVKEAGSAEKTEASSA